MWVSRLLLSSETRKCDCTEQALLQDSALRELGSAALYRGGRELTSAPAQPQASLPHAHQAESALSALGDLHTRKGASSKGHRGRRGALMGEERRDSEGQAQRERRNVRSWKWVSSPSQNCLHQFKGSRETGGSPWGYLFLPEVDILQTLVQWWWEVESLRKNEAFRYRRVSVSLSLLNSHNNLLQKPS